MESLLTALGEEGGLGLLLALSIFANGYQYRQHQLLHKENRDRDRDLMGQIFELGALIKAAVELLKERDRS
ncbi:MAG: hypothetical protein ACPG61_16660 [Paracoccaceae bacterium]